ncbi:hypothetical protein [Streptomyces sp. NRRL S-350]|uniref:hypothetical protein n=1 Tax=Streptomyces sp. NRRL S-350 TaxID=1463902 RepID=UPI000AF87171|nr:hypothetical protein [Streptomyces sp. NRRL S-350]
MDIMHQDPAGPPPGDATWLANRIDSWSQSQAEVQNIQDQIAQLQEQPVGGAS